MLPPWSRQAAFEHYLSRVMTAVVDYYLGARPDADCVGRKMESWLGTIGVVLVALLGIMLGRIFSSLRRPFWVVGYLLPALLVAMLVITRFSDSLVFGPAFFWMTAGREKFVILCLAVSMGLTTPLSRLPRRCEKWIVCILMVVVVAWRILPTPLPS